MRRRNYLLTLSLFGLFTGLASSAFAFGGHRGGGGTYHYNGSTGYWAGSGGSAGGATYANACACPPAAAPGYVQQATYTTPQPTYYAPQPTYAAPQNATYAQPQTTWRYGAYRR